MAVLVLTVCKLAVAHTVSVVDTNSLYRVAIVIPVADVEHSFFADVSEMAGTEL